MHRHTLRFAFAVSCGVLFFTTKAAAQSFTFSTINVPCAACPGGIARSTTAQGINPAGDIVGGYRDAVGAAHGYVLSGGQFTSIEVPGAIAGGAGILPTTARGINPGGDIVGNYTTPLNASAPSDSPAYCPATGSVACIKGFLYSGGKFSTVLVPDHPGAIPQRISPDGDIYGCLHDFDLMGSMFGFGRSRFGYISLKPSGGELADSSKSVPDSMNNGATPDGHTVVGLWTDMTTGHSHGYLVQDGSFNSYDVPGSLGTNIRDINPSGALVGTYTDSSKKVHGFLQLPDGSAPITIDFPNAVSTATFGINPGGAIVGQYTDTSGHTHGFLATPTGE